MSVTKAWRSGQEAVLAFQQFCLGQNWVFVEVPGQLDFGKDGYVDIVEDGTVTGSCFAVQIKGGRSHSRVGGFVIDASAANRKQWASSTMPVIGIAHSRETGGLHWVDLTELLNREDPGARLFVPNHQHLNDRLGIEKFSKYVDSLAFRQSSLLNLVADNPRTQLAGIRASYRIGRSDGRALVLLRRIMFTLDEPILREAVWALASAGPHPDIFGSWLGQVEPGPEAVLSASMRWTPSEIVRLLEMVGEDGFARGSFGQHVHQLLVRDPDHEQAVFDVAVSAAGEDQIDVAARAALLCVAWAVEQGPSRWDKLVSSCPGLLGSWMTPDIQIQLKEFGFLTLG